MKKLQLTASIAGLMLLMQSTCAFAQIPYVYEEQNMGKDYAAPKKVEVAELPTLHNLPDPFRFQNGKRSTKFKDWEKHRSEISYLFQYYEIGMFPSAGKESVTANLENNRLSVTVKHNGQEMVLNAFIQYPENVTGPCPALLGISNCLPVKSFMDRGCAIININVFDVTSHTQKRGSEPINRLFPELEANGSYCFWTWGVSRIIDGLQLLGPEKTKIDTKHLAISGCSWAGKAALYAGAFDERIALVIPQESGGGGIASWRYSETLGEVERSYNTNYSWFFESLKTNFSQKDIERFPIDHHELGALVCPRALLFFGNPDYKWLADESGYVSMQATKEVYRTFGIEDRVGFAFRDGHGHCQFPQQDVATLEAYIDRFLLGKDVDTNVEYAPMFENVDWKQWISNWKK